jgi:hypothetical protein
MTIQATQDVKREWGGGSVEAMPFLLDSLPIFGEVAINPANLVANTQAETTVSIAGAVPAGYVAAAGDLVFVQPPSTLEAGLVAVSARITANNTLGVTIRNTTAGAIDGVALNWTFMLVRTKRANII